MFPTAGSFGFQSLEAGGVAFLLCLACIRRVPGTLEPCLPVPSHCVAHFVCHTVSVSQKCGPNMEASWGPSHLEFGTVTAVGLQSCVNFICPILRHFPVGYFLGSKSSRKRALGNSARLLTASWGMEPCTLNLIEIRSEVGLWPMSRSLEFQFCAMV